VLNVPKGIMVPMLAAAEQQGLHQQDPLRLHHPGLQQPMCPRPSVPAWHNALDVHREFLPSRVGRTRTTPNWKAVMAAYADKDAPRDSFARGRLSWRPAS